MVSEETKKCSFCKLDKPIGEFVKNRAVPGGVSYQCKSCNTLVVRKSAYKRELRGDRAAFLGRMDRFNTLLRLMIEVLQEEER